MVPRSSEPGHRGARAVFPESSSEACAHALEQGAVVRADHLQHILQARLKAAQRLGIRHVYYCDAVGLHGRFKEQENPTCNGYHYMDLRIFFYRFVNKLFAIFIIANNHCNWAWMHTISRI